MSVASNIPTPIVPLVGADGRLSPVWFQFFMTLFRRTGDVHGGLLADVEAAVDSGTPTPDLAPVYAMIHMVEAMAAQAMANGSLLGRIVELESRLDALGASSNLPPDIEAQISAGTPVAAGYYAEGDPIGSMNPNTGRFTTVNKVTITEPANAATLTLSDGATLRVPAPGGTLGSAAFTSSGGYATATHTTLPAAATDAASTQALANAMRSALVASGIGS